eukprot:2127203-Rhodomonas_salina.4
MACLSELQVHLELLARHVGAFLPRHTPGQVRHTPGQYRTSRSVRVPQCTLGQYRRSRTEILSLPQGEF